MLIDPEEQYKVFGRLVEDIQKPAPSEDPVLSDAAVKVIEESLTRGWIYSDSLFNLISKMDCRLNEYSIAELAQVFDFDELEVWANSTNSIPTTGNSAVAMRNAAFLLIQLKAMGFRIEDTFLTSRMRPLLAAKEYLVGREFYIFWQKELEAKRDAFVFFCTPASRKTRTKAITLPLGHKMQIAYEGSQAIGVAVTPPNAHAA